MSPLYSRSPSSSPRSSSPAPSYQSLSSVESSPSRSDLGDAYDLDECKQTADPPTYSPIETFSDDEDPAPTAAAVAAALPTPPASLPASKKAKMSPSYIAMYQPAFFPPARIKRSTSNTTSTKNISEDHTVIGMILQILSRLAQAEMPHEHLCALSTIKALMEYLCCTKKPSKRAGRILLKLSKNLYCLMPFVNQVCITYFMKSVVLCSKILKYYYKYES